MTNGNSLSKNFRFRGSKKNKDGQRGQIREKLHDFFYALLSYLSEKKGWGRNESLNILLFYPTVTFTVGLALAQILRKRGWAVSNFSFRFDAQDIAASLFILHLLIGIFVFVGGAFLVKGFAPNMIRRILGYNDPIQSTERLDQELLRQRTALFFNVLRVGYWIISVLTLLIVGWDIISIVFRGSTNWQVSEFAVGIICLCILYYFVRVNQIYRKEEADKIEGKLALWELSLWTLLIAFTGAAESSFLYLYFITMMPALRRGFPEVDPFNKDKTESTQQQVLPHVDLHESKNLSIPEKINFNKNWSENILWNIGILIIFCLLLSVLSKLIPEVWILNFEHLDTKNIGKILADFYLHTAGWFMLLAMMAIVLEADTDSFQISIKLMESEIQSEWSKHLEDSETEDSDILIEKLANIIQESSYFRATGLLVASLSIPNRTFKNESLEAETYQIDNLEAQANIIINQFKLKFNTTYDGANILLDSFEFFLPSDKENRILSKFFYTADGNNQEQVENIKRTFTLKENNQESFFNDARSLGIIIFSAEAKQGNYRDISLAIFKSKWRGEFDSNSIKLYEALFVQVVGIHQKYQLYYERKKAAAESGLVADLAMTLTHDFNKQASLLATTLGKLLNQYPDSESEEKISWWMGEVPHKVSDTDKQNIWTAQFSSHLLRSRLKLVDRVARNSSLMAEKNGLLYRLAEKPALEKLPITKAIALGCWIAYNEDNSITVKSAADIQDKNWLQLNDGSERRVWTNVIKAFFSDVSKETLVTLNMIDFILPAENEERTKPDDVLAGLWKLVFNEIARNSKNAIYPCQLSVSKENEKLKLNWTSIFRGGQEQVRQYYENKEGEMPLSGEPKPPSKPKKAGSGWGQYGNYVVVGKMLEQTYQVFWELGDEPETHKWTTQLILSPPAITWR